MRLTAQLSQICGRLPGLHAASHRPPQPSAGLPTGLPAGQDQWIRRRPGGAVRCWLPGGGPVSWPGCDPGLVSFQARQVTRGRGSAAAAIPELEPAVLPAVVTDERGRDTPAQAGFEPAPEVVQRHVEVIGGTNRVLVRPEQAAQLTDAEALNRIQQEPLEQGPDAVAPQGLLVQGPVAQRDLEAAEERGLVTRLRAGEAAGTGPPPAWPSARCGLDGRPRSAPSPAVPLSPSICAPTRP